MDDSDNEVVGHSRSSSVRGISTDGVSTRASVSTAGVLTSRSLRSDSGGEQQEDDEVDKDSPFAMEYGTASSVVFPAVEKERQVIEDDAADPAWSEQRRHQQRFSRIRNRV